MAESTNPSRGVRSYCTIILLVAVMLFVCAVLLPLDDVDVRRLSGVVVGILSKIVVRLWNIVQVLMALSAIVFSTFR